MQMYVYYAGCGIRHMFATEGLKSNAPLPLIQRDLAGHASVETTQIYLDINPDEATAAYIANRERTL